jgi:predicted MFS family arabinose efflux permease
VHKVPILTETGITRQTAAQIAAVAGIAGLCGKLFTGWLLDRWRSSWIGGICLSLPALACALLIEPLRNPVTIVAAMVIFGYSAGAYLHICTYLTTRYGGLRSFGKIFGLMASLMALGSGVGPVVVGLVYDHFGSYTPMLMGGIPIALLCGMLVVGLGAYPDWAMRAVAAQPAAAEQLPTSSQPVGPRPSAQA